MEPSSPGARTRQRPQQLKRQEAYSSERAERFSSHEVPSPGRGDGKAGSVAVAGSDPETTLGRLLRRLPHEASCDGRAPITGRSTKPASGCTLELTTKGPLQKKRNVEGIDRRPRRLIPDGTPAAARRIIPRDEMAENDEQYREGLATIEIPSSPDMRFHAEDYIEYATTTL
jgi:hypothetical protein